MGRRQLHAVIFKDAGSDQWVAECLELDAVTQGDSEEHARDMLREAVELQLEDMSGDDLEMVFQPIEGEPRLHTITLSSA